MHMQTEREHIREDLVFVVRKVQDGTVILS